MTNDIVEKLNIELHQAIDSERQIVYILVETRKLLEREAAKGQFPTLKLYSDWIVHSKLSGQGAKSILKFFDDFEREHQRSGIEMTEYEPLRNFLPLTSFQEELIIFLSECGIDTHRIADSAFWQPFVQNYMAVIRDCPLKVQDDEQTEFVKDVSAQAWPSDMANNIYPGKRVIQWNWTLKREHFQHQHVCALI